jgi:hypothetical protein
MTSKYILLNSNGSKVEGVSPTSAKKLESKGLYIFKDLEINETLVLDELYLIQRVS